LNNQLIRLLINLFILEHNYFHVVGRVTACSLLEIYWCHPS